MPEKLSDLLRRAIELKNTDPEKMDDNLGLALVEAGALLERLVDAFERCTRGMERLAQSNENVEMNMRNNRHA